MSTSQSASVSHHDDSAHGSLQLKVFVSPTHPLGRPDATFSPTSSTLIYGHHDAVLVDTHYIPDDIEALATLIEDTGCNLTTIFITHGHADHYFGIDLLTRRLPGVRVTATPEVVDDIRAHWDEQIAIFSSPDWFGDRIAIPSTVPEPLVDNMIDLEGHRLTAINLKQADISPTSILHIPSLRAVIAGDAVYNGIHQMLASTTPDQWHDWVASVDDIAALEPDIVVAGHKNPDAADDNASVILDETRNYLTDFIHHAETADSIKELVTIMQDRYPKHGNLTTLLMSARTAIATRSADR